MTDAAATTPDTLDQLEMDIRRIMAATECNENEVFGIIRRFYELVGYEDFRRTMQSAEDFTEEQARGIFLDYLKECALKAIAQHPHDPMHFFEEVMKFRWIRRSTKMAREKSICSQLLILLQQIVGAPQKTILIGIDGERGKNEPTAAEPPPLHVVR